MNKKKTYINLAVLSALTIGVLFWLLHEDFDQTVAVIKTSHGFFLVLSVCAFIITLFTSAWILLNWIRLFNPSFKFVHAFKSNLLAVFARNVTPMQSGGQAMNVYVMNNYNVSIETSVFILSIDFIVFQTAQVLFSLFWMLVYLPQYAHNSVLLWGVIMGFGVNSGVLVGLFLLVTSSRLHHFIGKIGIRILTGIKVVKNPESTMKKMDEKISGFAKSLGYLTQHKGLVIKNLSIVLIGLMVTHSIPYLIAHTLNIPVGLDHYFEFVALSSFVSTYESLLPMPGGTGGLEAVFMMMYGDFVVGASLQRAFMIIWRFVTYYFIVIVGAIYFIIYTGSEKGNKEDASSS